VSEVLAMTLTAVGRDEIVLPVPIQILFGGCAIDPDYLDLFGPEPRWDDSFDEKLEARCASL
jgi:hypothetical protein